MDQQGRLLKEALAFTRENLAALTARNGSEVAELMDRAALGLYRLSLNDIALEAVDLALTLNPNLPSALQHKGIILLAMNQNLDQVLPLLDRALSLNPQDKNLWAGKGDALKLLGRPEEAVQAYLHAQQLDATSTQFVDRALKLVPGHPEAL
ncbi:tetratricopeptide repeat domain-containing protein, partial [mine drainage metagenome]